MFFKIPCPHCGKDLKVNEDMVGRKVACPYCQGTLLISDSASETPETPEGPGAIDAGSDRQAGVSQLQTSSARRRSSSPRRSSTSKHKHSSDTSNVSLVTSGLIGFACASALFAVLLVLKSANLRIGRMFWDSAGINFPTTLLMCWSFAILGLKSRQLAKQKSAMLMDVLPTEVAKEITLDSLDKFVAHIRTLPAAARESFLVNRVLRGIEHFRVRKSAAETVTMMESQSAIDANNVAGSYTIVKVFIWAMPILGFIGTVMGVSSAVSGLSATLDNVQEVSAVNESMKSVFAGLGTAFDTTLLALIMSMVVKIPTSAMQKSEDDLITIVDEYCNENLLRRLNDGREGGAERGATGGGARVETDVFREAVEQAMGAHHAELENWLKKLDAIGGKLTAQVAQGWSNINTKMQQQQEKSLSKLQQDQAQQAVQLQEHLQTMSKAAAGIQQTLAQLTEHAAQVQNDVVASVNGSSAALEDHFDGLRRGLNSLNGVLETLGDQQVVVQQVEGKRRGWFGRKSGSR